jgi:iron-sulfur cluster assembly protein
MEELINFTDNAINFMEKSVAQEKCLGIRINIVSGGCQGLTYELNFVREIDSSDLVLQTNGINVYIASQAVIFVSGMTMDYVSSPMGGSIVFENPNAKSRCGCGKSFCTVEDTTVSCARRCYSRQPS